METASIIILVLILLIVISTICVYFFFKTKIENFSMQVFGTKDIMEGFKKQELEYQNTPKSVSSLDSVLKPKIIKDFPSINFDELEAMAENAIRSYYKSLEKKELLSIKNASVNLNNKIKIFIEESKKDNISYSGMVIHRTVLNSYNNKNGSCIITFQTSLEYLKKTKKETIKVQDRVNTELIYVYDEKDVKNEYGVSLNCKNCGGPIKDLGIKSCPYCGTGVVEYTNKVWKVNDIISK